MKNTLDQNGYSGAILMDLSKAFDTINLELHCTIYSTFTPYFMCSKYLDG